MINFEKKKNIILTFLLLIGVQFFYSFLFPSYPENNYWKTVADLNFYNGHTFGGFDNSFIKKVYPLIKNYHMNLDGGGYLLLAHNFPQYYFLGNYTFLNRPLYPILVNLVAKPLHFISSSYSLTFVAGLLVNFALLFFTVYLFYLFLQKFVSFKTAFFSSILLIFSPFAHVWLIQPETNIFGLFTIILSLYLLQNYVAGSSLKKLVIFSLIFGLLLLGKKIFAISFFILFLALIFKRYKEGAIFLFLHLFPLVLWGLWTKYVWHLSFYIDEVSQWGYGVWLLNIFNWPWPQTIKIFIGSIPNLVDTVLYGFLVIPVIFALIGYRRFIFPKKNIIVFIFFLSFLILFFGMNIYVPRFGFWLFPVILPLAVLGIDEVAAFLSKYRNWYGRGFYIFIYSLIIFISSLNVYNFVNYG